jgi:hypothetical protein
MTDAAADDLPLAQADINFGSPAVGRRWPSDLKYTMLLLSKTTTWRTDFLPILGTRLTTVV